MNPKPALDGLRVIDMSTVLAGPNCARYLADFGADVIKVERPGGDSLRNMAWRDPRDGTGLWWKMVNRNKRTIALDLKDEADSELLVNSLSMLCPFAPEDKQALLEAPSLTTRRETLVTLIEFALRGGNGDEVMQ